MNIVGKNAVIAQAAEQFELTLLWSIQYTYMRSDKLGQDFGQLSKLQQASVRVFGKVSLRQHAETQKLLIMLAQMGEVARYTGWLLHVMESLTSEDCQAGAVLAMKILTHLIID